MFNIDCRIGRGVQTVTTGSKFTYNILLSMLTPPFLNVVLKGGIDRNVVVCFMAYAELVMPSAIGGLNAHADVRNLD